MKASRHLGLRALALAGLWLSGAGCVAHSSAGGADEAYALPPVEAPAPVAMDAARALGLWQSSFGAVKLEYDPQEPGSLMGVWLYERNGQEVIGFFTGPLRGNVLEFSWHEPAQVGDLQGQGFLVFETDGSGFSGEWWSDDQSRTGDWSGWRVTQQGGQAPSPAPHSYGGQMPEPGAPQAPPQQPQAPPQQPQAPPPQPQQAPQPQPY
ncbi:hypothetical protein [Haliangium ochraceum]|nr:hypothetical protein [Haliangium ochraceum]